MTEKILRFPDVKRLSGLSRATIYLQINQGLFPESFLLGKRMVGWRESEIEAIVAARIRGDGDEKLRALVAKLKAARQDVA